MKRPFNVTESISGNNQRSSLRIRNFKIPKAIDTPASHVHEGKGEVVWTVTGGVPVVSTGDGGVVVTDGPVSDTNCSTLNTDGAITDPRLSSSSIRKTVIEFLASSGIDPFTTTAMETSRVEG